MNILHIDNNYRMLANTADCESSPFPIVFRNLCEYYEQEAVRGKRAFHQILFILEGEGEVIHNGHSYPLKRGCAFFTASLVPVEYINHRGLISAFLTVTGATVDALSDAFTDDGFEYAEGLDVDKYLSKLRIIRHECETDMNQARLSSLSYEFFVDFLAQRKSGAPEYLESAVKYIEHNMASKITLEEIAHFTCVSVSKLSHGFKKHYGVSIFGYIIEMRLRYARNLILSPGRTMTKDVAHACGFPDTGYFCRAYKRRFGVTPREDGKTY